MNPAQLRLTHDLIDRLHQRLDWLEHERRVAERYAAAGARSGPGELGPITGTTDVPDYRVAGKALHPDHLAQACKSEQLTIQRDLYRALDRDPYAAADQRSQRSA